MARNRRNPYQGKRRRGGPAAADRPAPIAYTPREPQPPKVFGKPFIVLEAADKSTFVYQDGVWAPHEMTIAECRATCQVTELPQKVKQMTRYEVRCPVE